MTCDKCESKRLMEVYVQGRDTHNFTYDGIEYEGYSKEETGIYGNYGDAVEFKLCMECGKVQGNFPKNHDGLVKALKEEEEE